MIWGLYILVGLCIVGYIIYDDGLRIEDIPIAFVAVVIWPLTIFAFFDQVDWNKWEKKIFGDRVIIKSRRQRIKEKMEKYEEKFFSSKEDK